MGTEAVKLVTDADKTVAVTAPKVIVLLTAIGSKFDPAMVTVVPIGPEPGVNEVIIGCGRAGRAQDTIIAIKSRITGRCFIDPFHLLGSDSLRTSARFTAIESVNYPR